MKTFSSVFLGICLLVFTAGMVLRPDSVRAQNPDVTPYQISVPAGNLHTTCTTKTATTSYCFAGDGLYQSLNGAAYTQVATGGVASFNGRTGAVQLAKSDVLAVGLSAAATTTAPTVTVTLQ